LAHHKGKIGSATLLNTAISLVEGAAALYSGSLSLLVDSVHNISDELALVCLYLAFVLPGRLGRHSQRTANLLNSAGLVAISSGLAWSAIHRLSHPTVVRGAVPIVVGLAAAAANWYVAFLLREPARNNPAVRLAYLHNLGDVGVSLAPVVAGFLVTVSGRASFDTLIALCVATWLIGSTAKELLNSSGELLWPEEMLCGGHEGEATRETVSVA
jgi:cobalt-zinc-cadmium efflux system protein